MIKNINTIYLEVKKMKGPKKREQATIGASQTF
ncbi:rCG33230 [Rattus norvegicus]|uniref:RCG33230 n=1 Tax=Rattus norvegicus TaxID=10116 RepID=A6HDH9_RAT|nr:rCG33230 [Rattus norvegicus]